MIIQCKYRFFATVLFIVVPLLPVRVSHAHEPIFGLGPHVIYKGGIGVEVEFEGEKASGSGEKEKEYSLHTEVMYGITSDLAVTLAVPYIIKKKIETGGLERESNGISDLSLRLKYRFWRHDRPGIQDSAAVIGGIKLPTGDDGEVPKLGSGSTDFMFGFAVARESLKWYYFGDFRYRANTEGSGGMRKGNRLFADFAVGIRPWPPVYMKPDLVVLAELNWESIMRDRIIGTKVENSGGNQLFVSPGFFFTYRNWAIKGGIQIPVYQDMYGEQPEDDYRYSFSVEIHY